MDGIYTESSHKPMIKGLIKMSALIISTVIAFFLVLEIAFRYQWFDFYKAELKNLNKDLNKGHHLKNILICGDSFTADPVSYVSLLKDSIRNVQIINAAVPGSCIRQHTLYLPDRIKAYQPEIFIYQFYAGNDLFEIRHPYQSNQISFFRKIYWFLSDKILSLAYLNFRFAGVRYRYFDDAGGMYTAKEIDRFSVSSYSKREKFNYKAEPDLIENTYLLKNGRDADWLYFKTKFIEMINQLDDSVSKYFVFIPHESMLSKSLMDKHKSLGARFSTPPSTDYPLKKEIKALCTELNLYFIDYSRPSVDSTSLENLFYTNDPHLNRFGQLTLGKQLLSEIRKNEY